eukprot:scaffold4212_cov122-Isochrysis_galbana.AAC.22
MPPKGHYGGSANAADVDCSISPAPPYSGRGRATGASRPKGVRARTHEAALNCRILSARRPALDDGARTTRHAPPRCPGKGSNCFAPSFPAAGSPLLVVHADRARHEDDGDDKVDVDRAAEEESGDDAGEDDRESGGVALWTRWAAGRGWVGGDAGGWTEA